MIKQYANIGSVIQLNPEFSYGWGALLCIVEEVKPWGVMCYALVPVKRWEMPNQMYLRVNHEEYTLIGTAEWKVGG